MNPARQPPESLFAHREWVRNLARRLVADDATAEDVEQQTWLSAVLSPPRQLVDSNGHAQPYATLRFVGASGRRVAARTDAEGRFAVSGLSPGTYAVEASIAIGGNVVVKPCGSAEAGQRGVSLRLPP